MLLFFLYFNTWDLYSPGYLFRKITLQPRFLMFLVYEIADISGYDSFVDEKAGAGIPA